VRQTSRPYDAKKGTSLKAAFPDEGYIKGREGATGKHRTAQRRVFWEFFLSHCVCGRLFGEHPLSQCSPSPL